MAVTFENKPYVTTASVLTLCIAIVFMLGGFAWTTLHEHIQSQDKQIESINVELRDYKTDIAVIKSGQENMTKKLEENNQTLKEFVYRQYYFKQQPAGPGGGGGAN